LQNKKEILMENKKKCDHPFVAVIDDDPDGENGVYCTVCGKLLEKQ
jgi:hypothetical protein